MNITSELVGRRIDVCIENTEKSDILMATVHVKYILQALKVRNPDVFYRALSEFVTDEEFDDALEWITKSTGDANEHD